jgi:molybdate transport system substrate-binding protein
MWRSVILAVAVGVTSVSAQARGEVTVSAASSLTNVLQELAAVHERRTGDRIVLNLGASNTLARQIVSGARVDLFISADEPQMNVVTGDIEPGTRVNLLANELAIAVPDDRPRRMTSARELLGPSIRRIAIGDPAAVPAGIYARTYLERLGLWTALQSKLVPTGSVRLALAAVESGAADAAIVYRTDIPTADRARAALVIPRAEGPAIVYPAAVIRGGRNVAGGRRFLAFLRTPEAAAVFRQAGFIPLPVPSAVEGP